jgi:tRNA pseudouridine38-40 synthase
VSVRSAHYNISVPTFKAILAYDGTAYRGWQIQDACDTIQGRLETALARLAKSPVRVVAAGRTDSGVHAWAQVAHFRLARAIPPEGIRRGWNALLPRDIRVLSVSEVEDSFHARRQARSKTYRYFLDRSKVASPLRCRYTVHYPHALDRVALDDGAARLEGAHDFAGFRAASCRARTTVRCCLRSAFFDCGEELVYEIAADGFLHHMVRNIVGTLLEIGRGNRPSSSIEAVFASKDRTEAGPTAPARGLHLVRVDY